MFAPFSLASVYCRMSLSDALTGQLKCDSLIAVYTGTFQGSAPADSAYSAEFQFEIHSDTVGRQVTAKFDDINRAKTPDEIFLHIAGGSVVCELGGPDCHEDFSELPQPFAFHIHHNESILDLIDTEFTDDGQFVVRNAYGKCTNFGMIAESASIDQTTIAYCVCCGDEYAPDQSLNCPSISWSTRNPFEIDCADAITPLDFRPEQVHDIVQATIDAFESDQATKADVYELSHIFFRIGHIWGIFYETVNISENTMWAANDEDATSTTSLVHGQNVGVTRKQQPDCDKPVGFADFGDSFGPPDGRDFLASIEIPIESLCDDENSTAAPIYYAIYRNVNVFVPNSTDESTKQHHLVSGFYINHAAEATGQKFDPEHEPPEFERCAVGLHQNRNRVLSATVINQTFFDEGAKTMAVLQYKKEDVRASLHGKFKVTWWTGNQWSAERFCSVHEEGDYYIAQCDHLTDFTLLVDGAETDPILCDKTLSTFGYAVNSGSIASLLLLNVGNALNFFDPLRSLLLGVCLVASWARFKVDALTAAYNVALMFFYVLFTVFNDQERAGGVIGCQVIAGASYCLLLCCICLTLFQSWSVLRSFMWASRIELLILWATKPLVILFASIAIPLFVCGVAFWLVRDFFYRDDQFCWIKPTYVELGVVVPITLLVLNGCACYSVILFRMFPRARVFRPLRRMTSIQTFVMSSGRRRNVRDKVIAVLIMQFSLGIPWGVQYLTLFAPKATVWHYAFSLIIGSQGIVLLLVFVYKRVKSREKTSSPQEVWTLPFEEEVTAL
ncbi:hypothetical protein M3Y99_00223400 [Aphelenchoides fujianensis]|nr:hypothetical protein M3Y99_00223400 [Aphelenchoides fujianensis]